MTTVVVDSSALVALAIPEDALHARAVTISERLKAGGVTILVPGEVISETLNIIGKMHGRSFAVRYGRTLIEHPDLHLLAASNVRNLAALGKWESLPGGVSFTDCVVMAAADETSTAAGDTPAIFGFDEAFGKNGYQLPEAG